jgi:hypothetical protein
MAGLLSMMVVVIVVTTTDHLDHIGSVGAILGMPLTAVIARHNVDTVSVDTLSRFCHVSHISQLDAWIFLVGSSGSAGTNICFLYVLWRFPRFIKNVKAMGADPTVVVRLATFYQLNVSSLLDFVLTSA